MDQKTVDIFKKLQHCRNQTNQIISEIDSLQHLIDQFIQDNSTQRILGEVVREGLSDRELTEAELFSVSMNKYRSLFIGISRNVNCMMKMIEDSNE